MTVDAMKEMERKPYSSEAMRVRCPHCRKLYLVQFSDVKESKPKFECVQCRSRFWLSLPDMDLNAEITGIPVNVKEVPRRKSSTADPAVENEPCPKCFKPVAVGTPECNHCGVVIAKVKDNPGFRGRSWRSETLALLWKKVVGDYVNEDTHQEFLRACQKENNLVYASAQYGQMLKLMPADETTRRRVAAVLALGMAPVEAQTTGNFERAFANTTLNFGKFHSSGPR